MGGKDFKEKMQRGLPLIPAENAKVRDLLERYDGNDGVNDSYITRLSRANSRAEEAEAKAEALAEAIPKIVENPYLDARHVIARLALARYRGEK